MNHVSAPSTPYDIRARVFQFVCGIVAAFPRHERLDHASLQVWSQLIDSATSVGAHLEEANAAGTRPHFIALNRGALREMRESHYWLRLLTATQLTGHAGIGGQLDEANQLTAILTTIVKNTVAGTANGTTNKKEERL